MKDAVAKSRSKPVHPPGIAPYVQPLPAQWLECHTGFVRAKDLAVWIGGILEGEGDLQVRKVAPVDEAGPEDVAFVTRGKALKSAASSAAGCLLVPEDFSIPMPPSGRTIIRVGNPRAAAAKAIKKLHRRDEPEPGIHPTAVIGPDAVIEPGCHIGAHVVVGKGVGIGSGTRVGAGTVIGNNVRIGQRCTIHPQVTIYDEVSLGNDVVLHSGCVIGADGFGYILTDSGYEKFPQVGRVEIGDRVEIGANSCVDRAALGVTVIGDGTKLDNLVHVGHNCRIGKNVVVAAQTGFSGGVVVEDFAVIGGQVGIGDKARIESRAVLGSGSGVLTSKIVRAGQVMWGVPARPLKEHLEQLAVLSRLAKKRKTGE